MRIDTYVTPAQATSPVNPFQDPFGDRRTARNATTLTLQGAGGAGGLGGQGNPNTPGANVQPGTGNPAGNVPNLGNPGGASPLNPGGNNPLPGPNNPLSPRPGANPLPFTPGVPDNSRQPNTVPPNQLNPPNNTLPNPLNPLTPNPLAPNPFTPPGSPPNPLDPRQSNPVPGGSDPTNPRGAADNNSASNKPCDRIYNDLNCCDSDANCRAFIQRLMQDRLSKISLDITPRLEPNGDDSENEKQRIVRMRLAGKRTWHRRGVTVAQRDTAEALVTGTLHDLQNGRAIIVEESGQKREIPLHDLSEDDLCFISGWWKLPAECAIANNRQVDNYSRGWMPSTINWHASALCHKPLYFEQVQHERYGHTAGPLKQPFIDGAHFFGSALLLPYNMALDPPWECEYVLGYYRPGSCAPWQIPPFPFSPRAALAQAGFVVGGIYIIP